MRATKCVCPSSVPRIPFSDWLKSRTGIIVMSIVWGLGLAALFRKVCHDGSCKIVKKPSPTWVHSKVFKENNKCYQYIPVKVNCQ